ncbi:MAG TPA: hypothetical protein VK427_23700, partial [Kofleriaceae bacterium]|nr:hypothetical protein [Kofleriaceae bacterium]
APASRDRSRAPTPVVTVPTDASTDELVEPPSLRCADATGQRVAPAPDPTWFCARPDGTRHGPFVSVFPDGTPEITGRYTDGALDGAWERRHPSGALAETGTYVAGQKNGTWKQVSTDGEPLGSYSMTNGTGTERRWFDDGRLYSEITYRAGVEHGRARAFTPDGALIASARYVDGKLDGAYVVGKARGIKLDERYAAGVRVGKREIWNGWTLIAEEHYDRRGRLDGEYTLWRSKKVTRVEGRFAKGKRAGTWIWHDRDGQTERTGRYVNGKRHGTWTEYVNGKVVFTGAYTAGKPHGTFISLDRNGNELGRTTFRGGTGTMMTFWGRGRPASKTKLVRGVEDGLHQQLTPRGTVVIEGHYRGGVKHGTWKEWTADGVLVHEQTWKSGKLDGPVKKYVDGQLSLEAGYADGQATGAYTEHRNGKPAVTGTYASDRKTGTWTHYASDGSVVLIATYNAGVLDGAWRELVDGNVLEGTIVAGRRTGTWTLTDKAGAVKRLVYAAP